jgi:preprotein translocase subunit SecF
MRLLKLVPDNTNLKFVSLRKWAFGLTLMLSLIAVGLVGFRGLNMGVDFVGGVLMEQNFQTAPSIEAVRSEVDSLGVGEASIQSFSDPKTLSIRLPLPDGGDEEATNRLVKKVSDDLAVKFPGATFSKYDTITGKVSDELITTGLLSVGLALFAVVRFEWQFGVSTIVAIVHDLLMTVGFFALMRDYFEVDLNIVAAVLTIISYSINDKIVIDDRIRENMRRYRKMDMRHIIDLSVNETLPRTVMTSVTILLALFAMLILGGHVLRGFTAAMILGIVVGTYSSIYVSSSLLITLGLRADPAPRKGGVQDGAERVGPKVEH